MRFLRGLWASRQSHRRRPLHAAVLLAVLFATRAPRVAAQDLPAPGDSRHSMLRQAMLGLLPAQPSVPETRAQQHCLALPVEPPNDRLQGPHGTSLLSARCEVVAYQVLAYDVLPSAPPARAPQTRWIAARYRWTSLFTAEDTTRGPTARDTVTEEEAVLFDAPEPGQVRPVWHARFETGGYAVWRSVTPEIAPASQGATLLSVMSCVNGTGGCSQEFLQRHADGRWFPVWQDWFDQLPQGFSGRIRHGFRIDSRTLQGEAGFYGDHDPNCCPYQRLVVHLALRGASRRDSLVLLRQTVLPEPGPSR